MTKLEFTGIILQASRLCDDLLKTYPINERLLSSQAVLKEAGRFVEKHWPESFSEEALIVECAGEDLQKIQGRLMAALTVLGSFTEEMRQAQLKS